jgi:hypothetical protein
MVLVELGPYIYPVLQQTPMVLVEKKLIYFPHMMQ